MVAGPRPRSLVLATDIDVLAPDATVTRVADHLVVRSPGNPGFWWGNFLVFDGPPAPGDGPGWEAAFDAAFIAQPQTQHRSFSWDSDDDRLGAAQTEFVDRGYDLEQTVGLRATPRQIVAHPRANATVEIRTLDPDGDAALWEADIAMHLADHVPGEDPPDLEDFLRRRQAERRELFAAGRGAWYAALGADGELVGGCGVVATPAPGSAGGPRGRYQDVHVAAAHRGRGIASRLVVEAGADAARAHGLRTLVIAADADYHALGIYESLGFRRADRLCSVSLPAR